MRAVTKWLIVLAVTFLAVYNLPSLVAVTHLATGYSPVSPEEELGLRVKISNKWIPLLGNNSWAWGLVGGDPAVPAVLYYHTNWMAPWDTEVLLMTRRDKGQKLPSVEIEKAEVVAPILRKSWGTVRVLPPTNTHSTRQSVLVLEFGLLITLPTLQRLADIEDVVETTNSWGDKGQRSSKHL